ncbi:MAG: FtsW/RodA/SpoVE family cell cycle protein [Minisyncoccia bacterium]
MLLIYGLGVSLLLSLIFIGVRINGAKSWISFGLFTFQPADLMKLILIFILAKYLARRHVEIRAMKHVVVTGIYFLIPFLLIFSQPDLGSAIILFGIWFSMIMVSGISKKHLLILGILGISVSALMWGFVLKDYQKDRLKTFIDPLSDVRGAGYNAYQSTIAVGSGQLLGKGVGYGTQSRLSFLPESETDFIYAAISEEWGFLGSLLVLFLLFFIVFRILWNARHMNGNFETLFSVGVAGYFMTHIIINIGMNIGIMPVTGVTLPFVSYGGSHLLVEFLTLGVLMGMYQHKRVAYQDNKIETFLH